MSASHLYILAKTSKSIVILSVATSFIIIFGGFGVYLVEHKQPSANITTLGDAIWWAVVTLATVGYGDYYPVTPLGRIIAIFMMLTHLRLAKQTQIKVGLSNYQIIFRVKHLILNHVLRK